MSRSTQKRRTSDYEETEDDMSASLPRSVPATSSGNWDTTSVMSSSTMGFTGGAEGDDSRTIPTLGSKGVESLIFSGLSNIDEERPLRGMNQFARSAQAKAAPTQPKPRPVTGRDDRSIGVSSIRSSGGQSMFTEKKQEDIDRLFHDLLGQENTDNATAASSVMSSVMPIVNTPVIRSTGTTFNRARGRSNAGDVNQRNSGGNYSSNKYIFDENDNNRQRSHSSDHDLIYGDADDENAKKTNNSIFDRFNRFYIARSNRMLHVRAGFILMFLCAVMFIFLQTTLVNEHNREEMKKLREEYKVERAVRPDFVTDPFDENVDRPNSLQALNDPRNKAAGTVLRANRSSNIGNTDVAPKRTSVAMGAYAEGGVLSGEKGLLASDVETPNSDTNTNAVANTGPTDQIPKANNPPAAESSETQIQPMPESFKNLVDISVGTAPHKEMPYFWQVPRAGGGTLRSILSECMGAILAAEPGGQGPFAGDNTLETIQVGKSMFINVDTTYLGGIQRAIKLDLLGSGKADVVVSPYVHELSTIFTPEHQGRMFAFIHHPIERCASMYAYKKNVDPEIAKMSLLDYARSGRVENNWMTRYLSNQLTGEVTFEHVVIAKEVLRTKCLVGLKEFLWASIKRYEHFFGWEYTKDPANQYECRKGKLLEDIDSSEFDVPKVEEGTQEWTMLLWQNKFDMKLYKYAQELFKEQQKLFPDGFA